MSALTVAEIQRAVCRHFDITCAQMISANRKRAIARPRQIAMWLSRTLTNRSLPDIGRRFGGRDHTTALHAVRRIDALIAEREDVWLAVEALLAELNQGETNSG